MFLEHYDTNFMDGINKLDSEEKDEFEQEFNQLEIERLPELGQLLVSGDKDEIQDKFADLEIEDIDAIMDKL